MSHISHTAVLGAGVIGASWTALFLAAGKAVAVYDPSPNVEKSVTDYIEMAWPVLQELGLTERGDPENVQFYKTASQAVQGAQFIQESVPERIEIKHALYAEIENKLETEAVIASSASGLTLSEMQKGWQNPSPLILGHPFNPPHLIPLVEVMGNEHTAPNAVKIAEAFYADVGKVTIRVNKEFPGHVANRLQAALWREAIHLVNEGVASVEDVDTAVWAGPGLRWAAMGPHMLFHLGAGSGGMEEFCNRYADSFHRWWDDMGDDVKLTPELIKKLSAGVQDESKGKTPKQLSAERDQRISAMQVAKLKLKT